MDDATAPLTWDAQQLRVLTEFTQDYIAVLDSEQRLLFVNRRLARALGTPAEQVVGQQFADLGLPATLCARWEAHLQQVSEQGKPHKFEYDLADGHRVMQTVVAPIKNGAGAVVQYFSVTRDITDRRKLTDKLQYQALLDPLTGLLNRRGFEQELERLINEAKEQGGHHALCFLDLDDFKQVNDSCGHSAGDELLRQLPEVIRPLVRGGDIVARLGGDEFGVLLRNCQLQDASAVADKIRDAIRRFRFVTQTRTFTVGASIGLVSISADSEGLEQVLKEADSACYNAKDQGRNVVHVAYPNDLARIRRRGEVRWAQRLRDALDQDRLALYYQSLRAVNAPPHAPGYHELLLRLTDAEGEAIPPGAFLSAAERHGLMAPIDRWVIEHGIAAIGEILKQAKSPHRFGLNLGSSSLTDLGLVDLIATSLHRHQVSASCLIFELRETATSLNLGASLEFMRELRELGCGLALDDFGSGVSSFSYLKNLPVDLVKVDGGLITSLLNSPTDEAIVRAIHDITRSMGIKTVAESVENDSTLAALRKMGVDYVQGYGIARPRPLTDFPPL